MLHEPYWQNFPNITILKHCAINLGGFQARVFLTEGNGKFPPKGLHVENRLYVFPLEREQVQPQISGFVKIRHREINGMRARDESDIGRGRTGAPGSGHVHHFVNLRSAGGNDEVNGRSGRDRAPINGVLVDDIAVGHGSAVLIFDGAGLETPAAYFRQRVGLGKPEYIRNFRGNCIRRDRQTSAGKAGCGGRERNVSRRSGRLQGNQAGAVIRGPYESNFIFFLFCRLRLLIPYIRRPFMKCQF